MAKKFTKKIEDFTCEVCGTQIQGNGYTDHCPNCLWSKHVDINPGDREEKCQGLMEPVGVFPKKGSWQIIFRCQKCGAKKTNKMAANDNFDLLIKLATKIC